MAPDALNAFLELTPSKKMRSSFAGEAQGTTKTTDSNVARIEITMFRFASGAELAKAKALRDRDRLDENKQEQLEEKEEQGEARVLTQKHASGSGKTEEDFQFQISKEIDIASPFLMQAFMSNSFKPKRKEYNSFSEAKVTVMKLGHSKTSPMPYLELTFRGAHIVGYEIETRGQDPPEETVSFCFQSCEVKYTAQTKTGAMSTTSNIKGWNFKIQQELTS
jgi:type VI protein secretion system component Hcp